MEKVGQYRLDGAKPHLVYMPHCSKYLYQSILQQNFDPSLAKLPLRLWVGNDLSEYIGFVRPETVDRPVNEPSDNASAPFTTAKKKRKDKNPRPMPKDGVLERLGESSHCMPSR